MESGLAQLVDSALSLRIRSQRYETVALFEGDVTWSDLEASEAGAYHQVKYVASL
jgi:hypothetical protein